MPHMVRSRAEQLLAPYLADNVVRPNGDMDMHCPYHEDLRRSATINFKTQQWFCFSCDKGGGIQVLLKHRNEWVPPPKEGKVRAGRPRVAKHEPLPDSARIDGWHSALLASPDRLEWFEV